jgi:hypothetical protein
MLSAHGQVAAITCGDWSCCKRLLCNGNNCQGALSVSFNIYCGISPCSQCVLYQSMVVAIVLACSCHLHCKLLKAYCYFVCSGYSTGLQDGPGLSAKFSGPRGICIDYRGNLWVADRGNSCIRCGSGSSSSSSSSRT